jgi:hypothetical protein
VLLPGRKLLLKDAAGKPQKRRLVLLVKDLGITLGRGNGSADDPTLQGGSLRVVATGGSGFDDTYDLAPTAWRYIRNAGDERGYKFSKGTPVRKVLLKPGKVLKIVAKGDALGHDLTLAPDAVQVEFRLGEQRYCLAFDQGLVFKPEKKLLGKSSEAPATCPSPAP